MSVMVVGHINLDIIYAVDRLPHEHEKLRARDCRVSGGGSAANTAWWLARQGMEVAMCGMVGEDLFGGFALKELSAAGIDVSRCVRIRNLRTTIASIFVNPRHKAMVIGGSSFDAEAVAGVLAALDRGSWDRFRHIHVAARAPEVVAAVGERARARGKSASVELDGTYDPDLIARFDIVFSNEDELARAMGTSAPAPVLAESWKNGGPTFFMTRGDKGAALIEGGRIADIPTTPILPVDRTGGGDAFDAGVLFGWLRGEDGFACARRGLALARAVLGGWGARPDLDPLLLSLA